MARESKGPAVGPPGTPRKQAPPTRGHLEHEAERVKAEKKAKKAKKAKKEMDKLAKKDAAAEKSGAGKKRKRPEESSPEPESSSADSDGAAEPKTQKGNANSTAKKTKKGGKSGKKSDAPANLTDATAGLAGQAKYDMALPKLEADRQKRRDELITKDIFAPALPNFGVRVVDQKMSENHAPKLAGYTNCVCNSQLGDLWVQCRPIFKEFLKQEVLFTRMLEDHGAPRFVLQPYTAFNYLMNNQILRADIESNGEPDANRYPMNPNSRVIMYLFYLRACHRIMQKAEEMRELDPDVPEYFSGPAAPSFSMTFADGLFEAEDLFRALTFISLVKVKTLKTNQRVNSREKPLYKGLPMLPIYHTESSDRPNTREQQAQMDAAYKRLMAGGGAVDMSADQLMRDFRTGAATVSDEDALDAVDELGSNTRPTLRADIGSISAEQQRVFLGAVCPNVQTVFEDLQCQDKTFFGLTSSGLEAFERQARQDAEAELSLQNDNQQNIPKGQLAINAAKANYLKLANSMNQNSATGPAWEDSIKDMPFDVYEDLPEKDAVTNDNYRIEYKGMALKPWQVQSAHWLVKMLLSALQSGILGDDPGLGKTISVLIAICELSRLKEIERQEWVEKYEAILHPYRTTPTTEDGEVDMLATPDRSNDEHLIKSYQLEEEIKELGDKPEHKPVLIACPPNALGAWIGDISKYFIRAKSDLNIRISTFCSLGGKNPHTGQLNRIKGTPEDLEKFWKSLDRDDPQTSRTVTLTTFQSLQTKILQSNVKYEKEIKKTKKKEPRVFQNQRNKARRNDAPANAEDPGEEEGEGTDVEDEIEAGFDVDEEENPEIKAKDGESAKKIRKDNKLKLDGHLISIRVIDEAHRIKNPDSLQTDALYRFRDCKTIMLTATPYKNSVGDFHGLLRFMYSAVRPKMDANAEAVNKNSYRELRLSFVEQYDSNLFNIPEEKRWDYYRALEPRRFKELVGSEASNDLEAGTDILPLPSSMCVLKRVKGSVLYVAQGRKIIIGEEIPPLTFKNIECKQSEWERELYRGVLMEVSKMNSDKIVMPDDDPEKVVSTGGMQKRRWLQLASCTPMTFNFFKRKVYQTATAVHKLSSKGIDAFTFFHLYCKSELHIATPSHRLEMAQFITGCSCKLQFLCYLMLYHWLDNNEKMIVWCNEPITLFLVELLLQIFQFKFSSIHAGIQNHARVKAEWEFNNNAEVGFLVASSRSQTESMNLQEGGHIQVFLDPLSATQSVQAAGRNHRLGQKHPVIVYRLNTDGTYDQVMQQQYQDKFRVTVSAQTKIKPEHMAQIVNNLSKSERQSLEEEASESTGYVTLAELAVKDIRGAYADACIRELFGQRTNCYGAWSEAYKPDEKNMLPEEVIYRVVQGGQLMDRVIAQLVKRDTPKQGAGIADAEKEKEDESMDDAEKLDDGFKVIHQAHDFGATRVIGEDVGHARPATILKYLEEAACELAGRAEYKKNRILPPAILENARNFSHERSEHLEAAIRHLKKRASRGEFDLRDDSDNSDNSSSSGEETSVDSPSVDSPSDKEMSDAEGPAGDELQPPNGSSGAQPNSRPSSQTTVPGASSSQNGPSGLPKGRPSDGREEQATPVATESAVRTPTPESAVRTPTPGVMEADLVRDGRGGSPPASQHGSQHGETPPPFAGTNSGDTAASTAGTVQQGPAGIVDEEEDLERYSSYFTALLDNFRNQDALKKLANDMAVDLAGAKTRASQQVAIRKNFAQRALDAKKDGEDMWLAEPDWSEYPGKRNWGALEASLAGEGVHLDPL